LNIFVDTSAIFASLDRADPAHDEAVATWDRVLALPDPLITHSLVEVESTALIQRRLGVEAVTLFRDQILPSLDVVEIDREQRRTALAEVLSAGRRDLSLVDRVSFALMRRLGLERAFAFDRHFSEAGFDLIGPKS